jgi:hypothetical protein
MDDGAAKLQKEHRHLISVIRRELVPEYIYSAWLRCQNRGPDGFLAATASGLEPTKDCAKENGGRVALTMTHDLVLTSGYRTPSTTG